MSEHFKLEELVCQHVYQKYGEFAWNFFDPRLLILIDAIREKINKRIFVNTKGKFTQRGLRCIQCEIVQDKIKKGELYVSAHMLGKAADFDIEGLIASEVRLWLVAHQNWWPYPFRLEKEVSWVHLDLYNNSDQKVYLFQK